MGTAEKVCAAALAIDEQARRFARPLADVSLVLLELGGAFTAAVAVAGGRIVDGVGGSSGPLGFRAAGALDGEVAYLAGAVPKQLLFGGGAAAIAGWDADAASPERLGRPTTTQEQVAWDAFVEGAAKTAIALAEALPAPKEFVLSGRLARVEPVREGIRRRLSGHAPTRLLDGFAQVAKQGAQGAALVADGLAGGAHRELVETLGVREARGTVLDHLYAVPRPVARPPAAQPAHPPPHAPGASARGAAAQRALARQAAGLGRRDRDSGLPARRVCAARVVRAGTACGSGGLRRVCGRRRERARRAARDLPHARGRTGIRCGRLPLQRQHSRDRGRLA